jgi:hypothetical protein
MLSSVEANFWLTRRHRNVRAIDVAIAQDMAPVSVVANAWVREER